MAELSTVCDVCHSDYSDYGTGHKLLMPVAVAAQHGDRLELRRICVDCCTRIKDAMRYKDALAYSFNVKHYAMGCKP